VIYYVALVGAVALYLYSRTQSGDTVVSRSTDTVITTAEKARGIAVSFLRDAEAFVGEAYQDIAGVWTVGFGTVVGKPGVTMSRDEAEIRMLADIRNVERVIDAQVKVPLNSNQRAALISFVYNIGVGAFSKSTLLRMLNARNYQGAADQLLVWNKITKSNRKVFSQGLANRRDKERKLFLQPE
jgi:lysozyme